MSIGRAGSRAAGNGPLAHRHHRSTARRSIGEFLTADLAGHAPVRTPTRRSR